jgi:hypothetical protein
MPPQMLWHLDLSIGYRWTPSCLKMDVAGFDGPSVNNGQFTRRNIPDHLSCIHFLGFEHRSRNANNNTRLYRSIFSCNMSDYYTVYLYLLWIIQHYI